MTTRYRIRPRGCERLREKNGAALVVAIAVFAVLLAIAITFFRVGQTEIKVATNVEDAVRADFLNDAGISIAISLLPEEDNGFDLRQAGEVACAVVAEAIGS